MPERGDGRALEDDKKRGDDGPDDAQHEECGGYTTEGGRREDPPVEEQNRCFDGGDARREHDLADEKELCRRVSVTRSLEGLPNLSVADLCKVVVLLEGHLLRLDGASGVCSDDTCASESVHMNVAHIIRPAIRTFKLHCSRCIQENRSSHDKPVVQFQPQSEVQPQPYPQADRKRIDHHNGD